MYNENYIVIPDAGFFFFLALLMREEIRSGEPALTQLLISIIANNISLTSFTHTKHVQLLR